MPSGYKTPPEVKKFIEMKFETMHNNTAIARLVKKQFELDADIETIARTVHNLRKKSKVKTKKWQPKRLFYDIETSYVKARVWRGGKQYIAPTNIEGEVRIICVSYKWQGSDKVKTLTWDENQCDKELLKKFVKVLGQADEIVAHNGDRFDIRQLRTRCLMQGVLMFPKYRSFDTLKKARKYFAFHSNRLDFLGQVMEVGRKLDHEGIGLWNRVQEGKTKTERKKALKEMVAYCEQDVLLLEDCFNVMSPYVDHNTNFAVIKEGVTGKWKCPECTSDNVQLSHTDTTPLGWVRRNMKCNCCKKQYTISNKSYTHFIMKDFYSSD